MDKQHYKKLSVEFPAEAFIHLKMACARKDISLKDFVTQAVLKNLEDYEDEQDLAAFRQFFTEDNIKNAISLDQLKNELGFSDEIPRRRSSTRKKSSKRN